MADRSGGADWNQERDYWRETYSSRPYADQNRDFSEYEPGYRYGYESAHRHGQRDWTSAERDLEQGWDSYEHRGGNRSTWEQIKGSVRDAWDRVTGSGSDTHHR
jgi:hypothetical protein